MHCRKTGLADNRRAKWRSEYLYTDGFGAGGLPGTALKIILATPLLITTEMKSCWIIPLLWLVRIPWVQEGKMPELTGRLELLNGISKETERVARETLLQLLKRFPKQHLPAAMLMWTREIPWAINQFSLYASDPVYYHSYHPSKYVFQNWWENKQLNDEVLKERLKGPVYKPGRKK